MMKTKNIVFMGEKPLGLRCLQLLRSLNDVHVVGVCTRAESTVWWGRQVVREFCTEQGIPLIKRGQIPYDGIDLIMSVLYPFVVEGDILSRAACGAFNLHEAPLPRWRGCNGYAHAILGGDTHYGTTLHELAPELDAGGVVAEERFRIDAYETVKELYTRTSEISYRLACNWFPKVIAGEYSIAPLSGLAPTSVNRRESLLSLKRVEVNWPIDVVFRSARAFDFVPWEPAYFIWKDTKYFLFIGDALGRDMQPWVPPANQVCLERLDDIDWREQDYVINGLPRPVVVMPESAYAEHFAVFV